MIVKGHRAIGIHGDLNEIVAALRFERCLPKSDRVIQLQHVIAVATFHRAGAAFNYDRVGAALCGHSRSTGLNPDVVVSRSGSNGVVAAGNRDVVVSFGAVDFVRPGAAGQFIIALTAHNDVVSGTAVDDCRAVAGVHDRVVIAATCDFHVGRDPWTDINEVVPFAAVIDDDLVHPRERLGLAEGLDRDVAAGSRDGVGLGRQVLVQAATQMPVRAHIQIDGITHLASDVRRIAPTP